MLYNPNEGSDFKLMNVNESTVAIIPREENATCFNLLAIDDAIIEDEEVFTITFEALHSNDMDINATITITDNDGWRMY